MPAQQTDRARASRLGPAERRGALDRLDGERFDVVVIGGGVTGAGCALDAASRDLSVALLEQRDLASGTSSRSSKLIHGGLRYLEQLQLGLVREALRERGLLLSKLAPHLVRPTPFVYPLRHRFWERVYVGAGLMLYDGLASMHRNPLPWHRHLSRRALIDKFPSLSPGKFKGAILYWDAAADDARLTLAVARTAAGYGAAVATSVRVTGVLRDESGRVGGVKAVDLESGRRLETPAGVVVNATGVWSDRIEELAGETERDVTASKGIHLVVPRDRIAGETGFITRTPTSVLFVIPFGAHWLIGTTDTAWDLDLAHPAASSADIEYVLSQVNELLAQPLTGDDIVGVYAGLRPLVRGDAKSTVELSREHVIRRPSPAVVTIAGGKYTTYRVMAEDTIDEALSILGLSGPQSTTKDILLQGADGYERTRRRAAQLASESGVSADQVDRLLGRYGSDIVDVVGLIASQPDLAFPLPGGGDHLRAEVRYAATHEAALHLDDVLTRRTRISIQVPDRGLEAAAAAAPLLAEVLGWDDATVGRELEHYQARVAAERDSQSMPDDRTADAARMGAPDVRTGKR